ncbi:MAG: hypothetical protein HZA10_06095 [Nitrospirae bacterium]|nr:hypothetical protein [Nitrospirota bacterium]
MNSENLRQAADKSILIFSQQAGSAAALIPVIGKLMSAGLMLDIYALPPSDIVYKKHYSKIMSWVDFPAKEFSLLLTGYGHPKHTINREIFREAGKRGLFSIAFLDNYKGLERFLEPDGGLTHDMPDILAVMDSAAKTALADMGMPEDKLVVTGHPYLEKCSLTKMSEKVKTETKKKLSIPEDKEVCFLASEIIHSHSFYEPCDAGCGSLFDMDAGGVALKAKIVEKEGKDVLILVRPHPNEKNKVDNRLRRIGFEEADEMTVLGISDRVYGLTSMFTQLSVAYGVPTYNVEPFLSGWSPENSFLLPRLWNYLAGHGYLGDWKEVKASAPDHRGAVDAVAGLVLSKLK